MKAMSTNVTYHKNERIITFNGINVVDLADVPQKAKVAFYSKLDSDSEGLQTHLTFNESRRPFDFHIFCLSPSALITAIVENRLEIEGMRVNKILKEAYDCIGNSKVRLAS